LAGLSLYSPAQTQVPGPATTPPSENSQLIESALALISPDVHQILGVQRVLAGAEWHSVLLTEGPVFLLRWALLQGGVPGVRKSVNDA
jgi:hypothetical protein